MTGQSIHDRGRGPEIIGTRITVYTLLPHLLDPDATEAAIGRLYGLEEGQVAAARAYILNNPDVVLGNFPRIEARMTSANPREVVERARATRAALLDFKGWLDRREAAKAPGQSVGTEPEGDPAGNGMSPTFKQWLAERRPRPGERS